MEQSDLEKQISELELAVDRLRSLYEQYFVGIEKIEPGVPRKDVDRRIYALRKEQIRNTALRFRFQMVLQRYNTYQTHWQRVCREIENGTYKRHLLRAQRRFGTVRPTRGRSSAPPPPKARPEPGALVPADLALELAELDRDFAPAAIGAAGGLDSAVPMAPRPPNDAATLAGPGLGRRSMLPPAPHRTVAPPVPSAKNSLFSPALPARPPPLARESPSGALAPAPAAAPVPARVLAPLAPPPAPAPRSPPASTASSASDELSEGRLRQLYSELVETKRRQNESTASMTYQAVAKNLRESSDKLRKKHGRSIDFEVTVRDGKAILRPILK